MTMVEIRKKLKVMKNFAKCSGHVEMVAYYSVMAECFECLYKNLQGDLLSARIPVGS